MMTPFPVFPSETPKFGGKDSAMEERKQVETGHVYNGSPCSQYEGCTRKEELVENNERDGFNDRLDQWIQSERGWILGIPPRKNAYPTKKEKNGLQECEERTRSPDHSEGLITIVSINPGRSSERFEFAVVGTLH